MQTAAPEVCRKWLTTNGTLMGMSRQDTKAILARNLRRLMDSTPALDTQMKVASRADIAQSTVGRLLRGEVYAQLSQVEALAEAFKVDVTVLLRDDAVGSEKAAPENGDVYAQLSDEEKKQVADFAAFLASRHQPSIAPNELDINRTAEPPAGLKQRLMQAIQRELNDDTLNLSHEREQETKDTAKHRKRTSSK